MLSQIGAVFVAPSLQVFANPASRRVRQQADGSCSSTLRFVVARHSNRWHGPSFSKQCIHRNNPFNGTVLKKPLRSLNHLLAMMMADQKIKVVRLRRRRQYSILSLLRDRTRRRSSTENTRNCGDGQPQMSRQHLKTHWLGLSLRRSRRTCVKFSRPPSSLSQKKYIYVKIIRFP
jgi:hypothetical protein